MKPDELLQIHDLARSDVSASGISNVAVCTVGEAKGHGIFVNEAFITALVLAGNASETGIKARFGHDSMCYEPLGNEIGWFENFREVEREDLTELHGYRVTQAVADLVFMTRTKKNGDAIDHVIKYAKDRPEHFGTSIEFSCEYVENTSPYAAEQELDEVELKELRAVAVVSDPAANETGLFRALSEGGLGGNLNPGAVKAVIKGFAREFAVATKAIERNEERQKAQRLKKSEMKKTFAAQFLAAYSAANYNCFTLTFTDGTKAVMVGKAGTKPAVGAMIAKFTTSLAEAMPLTDGEYITEGAGVWLVVAEGYLVKMDEDGKPVEEEVVEPEAEAASNGESAVQAARKELAEQKKRADEAERQLAAALHTKTIPGATPYVEKLKSVNLNTNQGRHYTHAKVDEVFEGMELLRLARRDKAKYRLRKDFRSGPNKKNLSAYLTALFGNTQFATGAGFIAPDDLWTVNEEVLNELFSLNTIIERLEDYFTIHDIEVGGNAEAIVNLVGLDDQDEDGYVRPGQFCEVTPSGESVLTTRKLTVKPYHYYREYCPKEWGPSFLGKHYVNDQEIPFQSIVLDYLRQRFEEAFQLTLWQGEIGPTVAFDGLLTIIDAAIIAGDIPAAQVEVIAPTDANAVDEFRKLYNAIPLHLRNQLTGGDPLAWLLPSSHLDNYLWNYRTTFGALQYNTEYQQFRFLSGDTDNTFYPLTRLTKAIPAGYFRHVVTQKRNLHIGLGQNPEIKVEFTDIGSQQRLWVRYGGHAGVQFALGDKMVIGVDEVPV